jgi:hypothetical protein
VRYSRTDWGNQGTSQTGVIRSYRASGLTAAISLWNTVYMERTIDALKRKGVKSNEQLLSHLSPLGWEHINMTAII